jgi:hypothetical protein
MCPACPRVADGARAGIERWRREVPKNESVRRGNRVTTRAGALTGNDGGLRLDGAECGRHTPLSHSCLSPPQLLRYRRYTRDKCVRRDIIDNNCACGHYGTVSDFDIAKYDTVRT